MKPVGNGSAAPPAASASEALAQAAEWRLIGLLLERPRSGWNEEIRSLAREVRDPALAAAAIVAGDAAEGVYLDVLGPGGDVSPREVAYRGRQDPGATVADVSAFYKAFAYEPRAEDPPDHVAVEAGFAGYLRLKESYALSHGRPDEARLCAEALERFIEEHLCCVAEPLMAKLALLAPVPHLLGAASALLQRTGPAPANDADPFPVELEGDDLSCGGCPQ